MDLLVREPAEPTVRSPPPPSTSEATTMVHKCILECLKHSTTCSLGSHWDALELQPFEQGYPHGVQPVVDWAQFSYTSFQSHTHYCFVTQWPKYSLPYVCWFLLHHLVQTSFWNKRTQNVNDSVALSEELRAYNYCTVRRVSERSRNTAVCPIFTHLFCNFKIMNPILGMLVNSTVNNRQLEKKLCLAS